MNRKLRISEEKVPADPANPDHPVNDLQSAISRAPTGPGCYLWKNENDDVLYVGKAVNLRSRLRNYLNPADIKTSVMMSHARSFEWISTGTGKEALILEATLVKKHNPRFNVRLKDDKRYPYLCVSVSEPYPRIFITRDTGGDGNRYFGPYTDVRAVRNTLSLILKIFPVRRVPLKLPLKKPQRPCMNFFIKRCLGPCQGNIPVEEYAKLINEIMLFLENRGEILESQVAKRIQEYSENMQYEKAAIYRDMLANIRQTAERQSVVSPGAGDLDTVAFAGEKDDGQIVIMEIRGGRLTGRKSTALVGVENAPLEEILDSFVRDYYTQSDILPARILLPKKIALKEVTDYLSERAGFRVKILGPGSAEHKMLLHLAQKNAELLLKERLLAAKFHDRKEAVRQVQEMLKLPEIPDIIECYDISHLQGSQTVASGVMFVDGQPYRSGYRRYTMRNVEGINDPAMIRQAVARRLQKLINENAALPDLMVIDGGFTQLTAACEAAASLGAGDLPIIGLAKKREEIYLPGSPSPVVFDPQSPGMKLLRHIRDEAHRFGVRHHRSRRNAASLKHAVEEIPDIGQARKKALLRHFTDKKIERATLKELRDVPGIGPSLAQKILDHYNSRRQKSQTAAGLDSESH